VILTPFSGLDGAMNSSYKSAYSLSLAAFRQISELSLHLSDISIAVVTR
jgi:hypothetical protein